jgi:hypothetical protein
MIGCRRAAEPPAESGGPPAQEEPARVVEIDSEYFITYPGATVDTETLAEYPTRLLQRTDAKPAEVFEYYQRYYHGRGWTDGPKLDQDTFTSRAFVGEEGWVTLTIQAPEAGSRAVSLIYTKRP